MTYDMRSLNAQRDADELVDDLYESMKCFGYGSDTAVRSVDNAILDRAEIIQARRGVVS